MIAKIINGDNFAACVTYVLQKAERGEGQLLLTAGVREEQSAMIHDFEVQASMSQRIEKPVLHTSLSFHANDKLSDELMSRIVQDYVKAMGLSDTQLLAVRHTDREHPHCHLVCNKVDNQGLGLKNQFYNYVAAKQACAEIEKKYGLTVSVGKAMEHKAGVIPSNHNPEIFRRELQKEIATALKSGVGNYEDLEKMLLAKSIRMEIRRAGKGEVVGVSFSKGELKMKASDVNQRYSAKSLTLLLNSNQSVALNDEKDLKKVEKKTEGEKEEKMTVTEQAVITDTLPARVEQEEKDLISGQVRVKDESVISHHRKNKSRKRRL
jgi:hypothetical protein